MPLSPALGVGLGQRQADHCEFEATLAYRASSRTGPKATEKPFLKKTKNKNKRKKKKKRKKVEEVRHFYSVLKSSI